MNRDRTRHGDRSWLVLDRDGQVLRLEADLVRQKRIFEFFFFFSNVFIRFFFNFILIDVIVLRLSAVVAPLLQFALILLLLLIFIFIFLIRFMFITIRLIMML